MATTKTLAQLRTLCRQRADMVNDYSVSDPELTSYINASAAELYDLLVNSDEEYYTTSTTFTISSGNTYSLPAAFYKLKGLDYAVTANDYINVGKYNFQSRNIKSKENLWRRAPYREYRILGSSLYIEPADNAAGNYRLWYIPTYTELSDDADTLDTINHWYEYIVIDCTIKMLAKEESDYQGFLVQKGAIVKRIQDMAANRDQGEPEVIGDVYYQKGDYIY